MKIKMAFVCNAANLAKDNTVNALGVLSNMVVRGMPAIVSPLTLVIALEGVVAEWHSNKVDVDFVDPNGVKQLSTISFNFDFVPFNIQKRKDVYHTMCITLPPLTFVLEGDYEFKVKANKVDIGSLTFPVYRE